MLVVRDDEELRTVEKLLESVHETSDVRIVESGVKLVQHCERSGLDAENREQKRDSRHCTLAAGKERHALRTLARRTCDDVNAALERILLVLKKHKTSFAAVEELREHLLEVLVRLLERGLEHLAGFAVQVGDELHDLGLRGEKISLLLLLPRVALLKLAELVDCDHVHRTQRRNLGIDIVHLRLKNLGRWRFSLELGIRLAHHLLSIKAIFLAEMVVEVLTKHRRFGRSDLKIRLGVASTVQCVTPCGDLRFSLIQLRIQRFAVGALVLRPGTDIRELLLQRLQRLLQLHRLVRKAGNGLLISSDAVLSAFNRLEKLCLALLDILLLTACELKFTLHLTGGNALFRKHTALFGVGRLKLHELILLLRSLIKKRIALCDSRFKLNRKRLALCVSISVRRKHALQLNTDPFKTRLQLVCIALKRRELTLSLSGGTTRL